MSYGQSQNKDSLEGTFIPLIAPSAHSDHMYSHKVSVDLKPVVCRHETNRIIIGQIYLFICDYRSENVT